MIRFIKLALAHVILVTAGIMVANAAPQPLELLRQSILAQTTVDFSGIRSVVVFSNGEKVHGVEQKIDCDAPAKLRIVVIAPNQQRGKLCLINGRQHWEYDPTSGRAVHSQLPPPEKVVDTRIAELERLAGRMKMEYVGRDSVAGRPTHVVKVSTENGLPVKKMWVDADEYVGLKTQRFDSHGRVKSSAFYTRIDYSPSFAADTFEFSPPEDVTVVETEHAAEWLSLQKAEEKVGFSAVLPEYLPPGYRFCRDRAAVIDVRGRATIWLSFSNGADTFSLFESRATGHLTSIDRKRSLTWQDGDYRFTLMGALEGDEMQKVKASIRP